jgi:methyltransferase (TIGR00027 family)
VNERQTSNTAAYAAAFRALESVRRPVRSRLFEDPFATLFLSPRLRKLVTLAGLPLIGACVHAFVDRRWPGAMTSAIARTRLIDDLLLAALDEGVTEVVILGAGFDSRAYRLQALARCRVFELDQPVTQAAKKARLERLFGSLPAHVTFLETDLARQDLGGVLESACVGRAGRSFVIWEGVTHYLGEVAVTSTLKALSSHLRAGSHVVFTYLHRGLLDGACDFYGASVSKEEVARGGEAWIWGMHPEEMPAYLHERGMTLLQDQGADDYRELYWGDASRRMKGFSFYRVAVAETR